jgi:hypothetical protein
MAKQTKKTSTKQAEDLVEVIDEKAIVNIRMSTSFFQRLQALYLSMIKGKSNEDIQKFLEQVKTQKISNEEDFHLETLLIVLSEFQKNAKAEGMTNFISQADLKKRAQEEQEQLDNAAATKNQE